ncbi:MAG TPA: uroporphyrinogen decarboxylase family protein [Syntrophorhabdaceae bacterium]|nr:uroporphyrinogen decarboxylase family protein [Syntrophorhabdaceae bacterium]
MKKTPQELYREREKRVLDATQLKKPDRVPIMVMFGFFPARYVGMSVKEFMYDPDKLWKAQWKALTDFAPDMDQSPYGLRFLGPLLDALDFKQLLWSGHGLTSDHSYQFVEGEYMLAEEYDHFLLDPSDFIVRRYWPRVCGALKGLEKLRPLHSIITYYMGFGTGLAPFSFPEVEQALEALKRAGQKSAQIASYGRLYSEKAKEAGFPLQSGGITQAPFDTLGDFFRGTKGLMTDMYRRPAKVIAACEKLLPIMLEMVVASTKASSNPRVFIPLHKGLDGFMSEEQFKKFFWPTLKELMIALIDRGLTPCPLWEGNCTSRLNIIKDVPQGKAIYAFEATDMARAKQVLGGTVCIRGNVPLSILATGTPEDVRAYCKRLIDVAGKDGGFILDAAAALDDAKTENVRAMFEFTKEYGVY